MTFIIYTILGIVQGITEPIPVSSSGHILMFKEIIEKIGQLNIHINYEAFAIISNFGSLLAICVIFKDDIINLFKGFFGYLKTKDKKYKENYKYSWLIIFGTIPAGIAGLVVAKLRSFKCISRECEIYGLDVTCNSNILIYCKRL